MPARRQGRAKYTRDATTDVLRVRPWFAQGPPHRKVQLLQRLGATLATNGCELEREPCCGRKVHVQSLIYWPLWHVTTMPVGCKGRSHSPVYLGSRLLVGLSHGTLLKAAMMAHMDRAVREV